MPKTTFWLIECLEYLEKLNAHAETSFSSHTTMGREGIAIITALDHLQKATKEKLQSLEEKIDEKNALFHTFKNPEFTKHENFNALPLEFKKANKKLSEIQEQYVRDQETIRRFMQKPLDVIVSSARNLRSAYKYSECFARNKIFNPEAKEFTVEKNIIKKSIHSDFISIFQKFFEICSLSKKLEQLSLLYVSLFNEENSNKSMGIRKTADISSAMTALRDSPLHQGKPMSDSEKNPVELIMRGLFDISSCKR